jgi:hypothetical protein
VVLNGDCSKQELGRNFLKRIKGHFANEVAVVTPNGDYLAGSLATGLKKWQELPAEQRTKLAPLGTQDPELEPTPPPGGLILQVFSRALTHAGDGFTPYKTKVSRSWEPGRDFAWLTEPEWRSLIPSAAEPGTAQAVAAPIQDRLIRRYLIDLVRVGGNGGPRRPEQVLAKELNVTVKQVTPSAMCLELKGSARLSSSEGPVKGKPKVDQFQLSGRIDYDVPRKAISRFVLLAFSETGHFDEINNEVRPLGILFEQLESKTPADRAAPSSWGKDYFSTAGR